MPHLNKHSLWLRPYGDIACSIEKRIEILSEKYSTPFFEPHVTLLSSLHYAQSKLIQLTNTLASRLEPLDIVLSKADHSDEYFKSVFVHVAEEPELLEARKTAQKIFGVSPKDFQPHLSLLYGNLDPDEKERILNVMGREFHIRFRVRHLMLVNTTGPVEDWQNIHQAEFGRKD